MIKTIEDLKAVLQTLNERGFSLDWHDRGAYFVVYGDSLVNIKAVYCLIAASMKAILWHEARQIHIPIQ